MKRKSYSLGVTLVLPVALLFVASHVQAHFLWLDAARDGESTEIVLFFGEAPEERDYHLPDSIQEATIFLRNEQSHSEIETAKVETDDFVGLRAISPQNDDFILETTQRYGVYRGTLLTYCAKHVHCKSPTRWSQFEPSLKMKLQIIPKAKEKGVECLVLWQGEPLSNAVVTLTRVGTDSINQVTDKHGRTLFEVEKTGTLGFYTFRKNSADSGELNGQEYGSATYYSTLTINTGIANQVSRSDDATSNVAVAAMLPNLPEPVASFGAVVHQGWVYVYSGHTGMAHEHSRDNLSPRFLRIKLDGRNTWEELPMVVPLQGLPLVAHGDYVYRVGGMNARNPADEDEDLHSVCDFSRFDPTLKTWTDLPPLPEPRSSHDAVVIGDTLYVVGGWELEGPGHGEWHPTAWAFGLNGQEAKWKPLPKPPFLRRALAACHLDGKLLVVGGMTDNSKVTGRIDIFDPVSQVWSVGPEFPGDKIHGFGISAWNLDGAIYASGIAGVVYRLGADHTRWSVAGHLKTARFFHRILPASNKELLIVGGASMKRGHLADSELLTLVTR